MSTKIDGIRDSEGNLPSYGWPGGYPIVYLDAEGGEWDADCANQDEAEPTITDYYVHFEGAPVVCNGCSNEIPSAYGDPDDPEEDKVNL